MVLNSRDQKQVLYVNSYKRFGISRLVCADSGNTSAMAAM